MSLQSDAAKAYIEKLLEEAYPHKHGINLYSVEYDIKQWFGEYHFAPPRRWAFDYAVPAILCANSGLYHLPGGVIEIDGGTFQGTRTGHSSGVGLRAWREKHNAAMLLGWRVWHYSPEEVIHAGRKRPFADSQALTPSTIPLMAA